MAGALHPADDGRLLPALVWLGAMTNRATESRTEQFMMRFNEIEQHLRDSIDSKRNVSFGELIGRAGDANAAVRHYARDLKEWADLRNAVVHEHPKGRVIAEITPDALAEFEAIVDRVVAPPAVFPLFQRQIRVFTERDLMIEALRDLVTQHYSQVIVKRGDTLLLLSFAGIARWLGTSLNGTSIELNDAAIGDAMQHEEDGGIAFLGRGASVYDAREKFQTFPERRKQRLRVIVITEHGKPAETPLGLIFASDLVEVDL